MTKGKVNQMELLKAENVQILESAADWKDAIRKSAAQILNATDEKELYGYFKD